MPIPNFLLAGVPKAGTSALYTNLAEHPEVFMSPVKEPEYFSQKPREDGSTIDREEYLSLFDGANGERYVGEASPDTFHGPTAAEQVYEMNPNMRIVVSLRQPVERAYSHYRMMLNSEVPLDDWDLLFRRGIEAVRNGQQPPFGSGIRQSFYSSQLKQYWKFFGSQSVHVIVYEDYRRDPSAALSRLFEFLDIDPTFRPKSIGRQVNPGHGVPRRNLIRQLVFRDNPVKRTAQTVLPRAVRRWGARHLTHLSQTAKTSIGSDTKEEFTAAFASDILELEQMTGRQLSTIWGMTAND